MSSITVSCAILTMCHNFRKSTGNIWQAESNRLIRITLGCWFFEQFQITYLTFDRFLQCWEKTASKFDYFFFPKIETNCTHNRYSRKYLFLCLKTPTFWTLCFLIGHFWSITIDTVILSPFIFYVLPPFDSIFPSTTLLDFFSQYSSELAAPLVL